MEDKSGNALKKRFEAKRFSVFKRVHNLEVSKLLKCVYV